LERAAGSDWVCKKDHGNLRGRQLSILGGICGMVNVVVPKKHLRPPGRLAGRHMTVAGAEMWPPNVLLDDLPESWSTNPKPWSSSHRWDPSCSETREWQSENGIDKLEFGGEQPFYQVLVDLFDNLKSGTRSGLIKYVAQEMLTTPEVNTHPPPLPPSCSTTSSPPPVLER